MRLAAAVLLALGLLSAGCARGEEPQGSAPRTRPLADDGTMARAVTSKPDRARVQLDLAACRGAVRTYHALNQAFPASLSAADVPALNYPGDLEYDPGTGTVKSQTYPEL